MNTKHLSKAFGKLLTCGSIVLSCSVLTSFANADWSIDNEQSSVHFISTKKGSISEVHHFKSISGTLSEQGELNASIDLSSVDTNIGIRNERMVKFLFEATQFPTASINTAIDTSALKGLNIGDTVQLNTALKLNLHGVEKSIPASLQVSKLSNNTLLASTVKPLIVQAGDYQLTDGIEKLRQLAGLPSISSAVPVTFSIVMTEITAK